VSSVSNIKSVQEAISPRNLDSNEKCNDIFKKEKELAFPNHVYPSKYNP
jgi:hypothetical protein